MLGLQQEIMILIALQGTFAIIRSKECLSLLMDLPARNFLLDLDLDFFPSVGTKRRKKSKAMPMTANDVSKLFITVFRVDLEGIRTPEFDIFDD